VFTFDLAHGYESFTAFCAEVGYDIRPRHIPDQFDDELQAMDASMSFCEPVGTDQAGESTTDKSEGIPEGRTDQNLNGRKDNLRGDAHTTEFI
jgi:hypothetical protein